MKLLLLTALAITPATTCVAAAFYLAAHDVSGWGWFLFVAVLSLGITINEPSK